MSTTTDAEFDDPERKILNGAEVREGHVLDMRPLWDYPVKLGKRRTDIEAHHDGTVIAFDVANHQGERNATVVRLTKTEPYTALPFTRLCRECGEPVKSTLPVWGKFSQLCGSCIQWEC